MNAFNGKFHVAIGVVFYLYLVLVDPRLDHLLNPIFVIIGCLLPDCDHRKAPAGRFLPLWLFFKHRGFTHTIWGMMGFALLTYLFFTLGDSISLLLGYVSHLLTDSLTPSGVNWIGRRKRPSKKRV